jgi:hypothetical protein
MEMGLVVVAADGAVTSAVVAAGPSDEVPAAVEAGADASRPGSPVNAVRRDLVGRVREYSRLGSVRYGLRANLSRIS